MANENMIKFLRGNVANLPQTATAGALYFTKDEGVYLGLEDGSYHRYGDFITVADVNSLPATGAHATCMYYCTAENILARYDSAKGWIQINKQPTAEELKTLLGLGSLAYKSTVVEGDLSAELAEKVNAAAEGNHAHANKGVLDGITADKVTAWDSAEGNAKTYADGLNTAMNTRVEALEAIDHEHANKALLDTYTQTEADLADAVAKKHAHTFVESELNKIVAGDVAKWNGVVADHLTAADKTAIEDSIGDVNTALENYKTSNNEALAGVKATADAAAVKSEVETALSGKVDKVEGKSLISDTEIARLAGVTNYDDTAVKADIAKKADAETMTTELGKKVDKVDGKDLIATSEIERLATLHNYDDTALAGRVTTTEGKITALETASATHATKTELGEVDAKFADYTTTVAQQAIDAEQDRRIKAIEDDYLVEADIANFETKENVKKVADDLAAYVESNDAAIADRYTKEEADGKFALIADAYDDEEVRGLISDNADAIAAEAERAAGIEAGLRTDVDGIKADYLKAADKTELQDQITANANAISVITNGIDPEKIDGLNDLIEWADEHAPEVKSIKEDIEANTKAIEDHEALAAETYETKDDATSKKAEIDGRLDALEGKVDVTKVSTAISSAVAVETGRATEAEEALAGRIKDLEDNKADYATKSEVATAKGEAITAAETKATELDAALKTELQAEIDADVKALADTVYIKTEVYTQAEVDALIAQAHTWGEF